MPKFNSRVRASIQNKVLARIARKGTVKGMDETLSAIKRAEEAAAALKQEAVDNAASAIERARAQASADEARAADARAARRNEAIAKAESDGRAFLSAANKESGEKAESYAAKALECSDGAVLKMVKVICRGDC